LEKSLSLEDHLKASYKLIIEVSPP